MLPDLQIVFSGALARVRYFAGRQNNARPPLRSATPVLKTRNAATKVTPDIVSELHGVAVALRSRRRRPRFWNCGHACRGCCSFRKRWRQITVAAVSLPPALLGPAQDRWKPCSNWLVSQTDLAARTLPVAHQGPPTRFRPTLGDKPPVCMPSDPLLRIRCALWSHLLKLSTS